MIDRRLFLASAALAVLAAVPAQAQVTINVVTAGDQNMVDYITDFLAPQFEKRNPGVRVRASGTGPGDAGSQKIYEKLAAQQKAGTQAWDIDVAVVHQKMAGTMVQEKLLAAYRDAIEAGKLVTRDTAKRALGANVDGFVLPMSHSQTALAYNPPLVKDPPSRLNWGSMMAPYSAMRTEFGARDRATGPSWTAFSPLRLVGRALTDNDLLRAAASDVFGRGAEG